MERARFRYIILGLSDGLLLGIGLSLGVSFFHVYSVTIASILLAGFTNALSNMFATYNAETFTAGQQMREYKEVLFLKDYSPEKITRSKREKSIRYALISFIFTVSGSLIVLSPYVAFYSIGQSGILPATATSLIASLLVLGFIGSYNYNEMYEKLKGALKTMGIGLSIAALSTAVGFIVSSLI